MAMFTLRQLVQRARLYLGDDHQEKQGWIRDSDWLPIAIAEWQVLMRRWIRNRLIRPRPTDTSFQFGTGPAPQNAPGQLFKLPAPAIAVVGVAQDLGTYIRLLEYAGSMQGAFPFWHGSSEISVGTATMWSASGTADELTIEANPLDTQNTYIVRWIPAPAVPQSLDDSVELPLGTDERVVLGMAQRALLKEGGSSALLQKLIGDHDAETQFAAWGGMDGDGPRVRRVPSKFHRKRWPTLYATSWPMDPNYFMWP